MLVYAIVGHLMGDYILQNDWMAQNKKRAMVPLLVHCTLWTLCVCCWTGWWQWWVILGLFLTHMIQDGTSIISAWMRANGQTGFATPPLPPGRSSSSITFGTS